MYRLVRLLALAALVVAGTAATHAAMTTVHFKDQLGNPIVDKEIVATLDGEKVLLGESRSGSFVLDLADDQSVVFSAAGADVGAYSATEIAFNAGLEMTVTLIVRPENAECRDAEPIAAGFEQRVSTADAVSDLFLGGQTCGTATNLGMTNGIWFSVTGTGDRMVASTCRGANFDTQLAVFCRGCSQLTGIDGNDDACTGTLSQVAWDTQEGMEYMLYVTGFGEETGDTWLRLDHDGSNSRQPEDCTPDPTGACCFDETDRGPEADCENLTEDECRDDGGIYQGDGTDCATDPTNVTHELVDYPGLAIPDAGGGAITSTLEVTDSFFIADLDVTFITNHTFVSDLNVFLTGPDGTTVALATGSRDICSNERGAVVLFDGDGPGFRCGESPVTGSSAPAESLATFNGRQALGSWTITVEDTLNIDTGRLFQWSLDFDEGTSPCGGACCTDGPGKGSDCIETSQSECESENGTYIGGSCNAVEECAPLLVAMESLSATLTRGAVVVRWVTAMEIDTVGFRVLRADSARGKSAAELTPVGPLVLAAGHGLSGASYELRDASTAASTATVYFVEDIDIFGKRTLHGPIQVERAPRQGRGRTGNRR